MQFTPSFRLLLQPFRGVFTAPAFRLFVLILTGWALSSRHRFITECIFTAGQVGIGHWSCFHRCFSHDAWSLDDLCRVLTRLLRDRDGKRPDHRFYWTRLDWSAREVLSASASRWALEHALRLGKQEIGLKHFEGQDYTALLRHLTLCLLMMGFVAEQAARP